MIIAPPPALARPAPVSYVGIRSTGLRQATSNQRISLLMRRHYCTIMAAKVGIQGFGHGVRPISSGPTLGVRGDSIGATPRTRAP